MVTTIAALMRQTGVAAYPDRWAGFFDEVMADYDAHGCPLTDPSYYDRLHDAYGVPDRHLPLYKQAALAVAEKDPLCRLLALLCRALCDREYAQEDFTVFKAPAAPDGRRDIAYDMLPALALCSTVSYTYRLLKKRGMPDEAIAADLQSHEGAIDAYEQRFGGAPGCHLLQWLQYAVDGCLFRLGRLEFQIFTTWKGHARVFENKEGSRVMLADGLDLHQSGRALGSWGCTDETNSRTAVTEETDDAWIGCRPGPDGLVGTGKTILKKAEWREILSYGDPTVGVHIPGGGPLDPAEVDDAIKKARVFFAKWFPDYSYRAFTCTSWLLDPQLETLLDGQGNILRFARRFDRITRKSEGEGVFQFLFLCPPGVIPHFEELPENSRLQRAVKAHYLAGGRVYEVAGYFI